MNTLRTTLRRICRRWERHSPEDGQSLAEYALILAFVAIAAVTALSSLGRAIANSPGFDLFQ